MRETSEASDIHLRLAGTTRLRLGGRGPTDAFLFDPHRLALPCWALALGEKRSSLLITFDRHLDLVPPRSLPPPPEEGLRALDTYARWSLSTKNVDHVLAAMEAGYIGDAIVIARTALPGAVTADSWLDSSGGAHRLLIRPSLERLLETDEPLAQQLIQDAPHTLLDIDLDCFTTPSEGDPFTFLPWSRETIRSFLCPARADGFWDHALATCVALTIAREPYHCGGVLETQRLFEDVAPVLFEELLKTDLP